MKSKQKSQRQLRRKRRTRAKVFGKKDLPRFTVFRSDKYIYAQLVDDERGATLVAASEKDIKAGKFPKTEKARLVGKALAKKAKRKRISSVVFDRGGYRYQGRVKALAEGARKGGLSF